MKNKKLYTCIPNNTVIRTGNSGGGGGGGGGG